MAKLYLILSAADPENNFIGLWQGKWIKHYRFKARTSEGFFKVWARLIDRRNIRCLEGVVVHQGSGSFSGLRLVATIANAIKIVLPKVQLFVVESSDLDSFLKAVEAERWDKVRGFVEPLYPAPPSIDKTL